jgi:hypothetical protein
MAYKPMQYARKAYETHKAGEGISRRDLLFGGLEILAGTAVSGGLGAMVGAKSVAAGQYDALVNSYTSRMTDSTLIEKKVGSFFVPKAKGIEYIHEKHMIDGVKVYCYKTVDDEVFGIRVIDDNKYTYLATNKGDFNTRVKVPSDMPNWVKK